MIIEYGLYVKVLTFDEVYLTGKQAVDRAQPA